jgi:hypothetical protein
VVILQAKKAKTIEYALTTSYGVKHSGKILKLSKSFDTKSTYQITEMIFRNGTLIRVTCWHKVPFKTPSGFTGWKHVKLTNVSRFLILDSTYFAVKYLIERGFNLKTVSGEGLKYEISKEIE